MNDVDYAVDTFIGECARRGLTRATREKYQWLLFKFAASVDALFLVDITRSHCTRFLDRWVDASPSTIALHVTILRRFFEFLLEIDAIDPPSPMETVRRPKRPRPEDLDVVTLSDADVERMFSAIAGPPPWDELVALALIAYLGPRRSATAFLRRRDLDLERGFCRFREKGRKVIEKPIPDQLLEVLRLADEHGVWLSPDDYVVPNRRPQHRKGERSNKVIYRIVTDVAARARVRAHPHAIRAAFAVRFDEQHPREVLTLKDLLGHARLETTIVYLRRRDRARAMESVRDLTWGSLPASALSAHAPSGIRTRATALKGP